MKKTYVLKPKYRKVLDVIKQVALLGVLILIMYLLGLSLRRMDERNYNHALERCGSTDNMVEHHTKEGDVYWTCIIDK